MAWGIRSVYLSGNVGGDAEMRFVGQQNTPVLSFNLAVSRPGPKGQPAETDWYRIQAWGQLAERYAGNVFKGEILFVSGDLQVRKYPDKNGVQQTSVEVNAFRLAKMQKEAPRQAEPVPSPRDIRERIEAPQGASFAGEAMELEDLPF